MMSVSRVNKAAAPLPEAEPTNGSEHSTIDEGSAHGSTGRQSFLSQLRPLQVKKSRSVNWAKSAQESVGSTDETTPRNKLPTTPYPNHLSSKSGTDETTTRNKLPTTPYPHHLRCKSGRTIEQLSQLESPQVRELTLRLGNMNKIETPQSSKKKFPNPYAGFKVRERWEEIQGGNGWEGLLDPMDPVLRAEIVRYGEFATATGDAFDGDTNSKYCGSSKYTKNVLLEGVGLDNRGYEITDFLYATAEIVVPNFFSKSVADDAWSNDSNWMGYVAVCTAYVPRGCFGRRDIVVAWRGTTTKLKSIEDVQDYAAPAGFDPRGGNANVMVESGFLSVYKSSKVSSRYNKTSAREQVLGAVNRLVAKYKHEDKLSITVVGHGVGSALATLCAYDLAESQINRLSGSTPVPKEWNSQKPRDLSSGKDGKDEKKTFTELLHVVSGSKFLGDKIPITVFSFAGPRVGNRAFKERVEALGVAVLRVVNTNDLVPKVPTVLRFQHGLEGLKKIRSFLPPYKHVGQKLIY